MCLRLYIHSRTGKYAGRKTASAYVYLWVRVSARNENFWYRKLCLSSVIQCIDSSGTNARLYDLELVNLGTSKQNFTTLRNANKKFQRWTTISTGGISNPISWKTKNCNPGMIRVVLYLAHFSPKMMLERLGVEITLKTPARLSRKRDCPTTSSSIGFIYWNGDSSARYSNVFFPVQ